MNEPVVSSSIRTEDQLGFDDDGEPTYGQVLAWQAVKTTISEITPLLWIGGLPIRYGAVAKAMLEAEIKVLVSTTHRTPHGHYGMEIVRVPFDDHRGHLPDLAALQPGVDKIRECLENNVRVMSHCAYGLNRSGLLAAIALHETYGWDGITISKLIREKRQGALWNPAYRTYVESLVASPRSVT